MSLRELYQEMIIDHGKTPRNFGKLADANHCQAGRNPLCGDHLLLYVLTRDGVIKDIRFEGNGCAISVASASLMSEAIKGKTLAEVQHLFDGFHLLLTEDATPLIDLGKLAVFSGVKEFPARVKCATLAWHTLQAALHHQDQVASTE